ncbi:MAG: hypothetical protein GX660_05065 [Clostridiaceae bacterium]|nr:hypothetical protein [Clostridiaceae bacterium]
MLGDVTTVYAATLDSSAMVKISDETNFASITHAIARNNAKYGFKYTVYELYDKTTGAVKYVGRTRQPLTMRKMQHWATDSAKKGLQIQVARIEGKELKGLLYSEARGLEQLAYENYTKNGIKLLNKIRPLSNSTKKAATKAAKYLDDAGKFLKKII